MKEHVYHLIDFEQKYEINKVFQMDLISIMSETLADMAELKDEETGHHINRVAVLGELVARALVQHKHYPLDEEFIQLLRISIPLHDIGKIGIKDDYLLKPGKLTDEEFEIMKTHTTIGAHLLEVLHERIRAYEINYFQMARSIAYFHHERFDGLGYPMGLKGNEIPIEAQITSIVDVFDALMSKRPYKESFTMEKSISIIMSSKGKQFNPELVDVLIAEKKRIEEIYHILKDE
ncbi:MAG: HD domain-containing protein [Clostridia bacterium]|nr:HD domain-containing protein [Clostridia bacterium]